jgi:hypothetical protein
VLQVLADILTCGRLMAAWGIDRDDLVPWLLAAAASYVAMSDRTKAVDLISDVVNRPRRGRPNDGA